MEFHLGKDGGKFWRQGVAGKGSGHFSTGRYKRNSSAWRGVKFHALTLSLAVASCMMIVCWTRIRKMADS